MDNECMEKLLLCSNEDCNEEIKRECFDTHVQNECQWRLIACDHVKFGCKYTQIKANEMEQHLKEYQIQHMNMKFDFIVNKVYLNC